MEAPDHEFTRHLEAWSEGDPRALSELIPLVFDEMRQLARRHLRNESPDHTLQPTALVHEVYLRLMGRRRVRWQNRAQFFAFAGKLMRLILVDHARRRGALKRGRDWYRLQLESGSEVPLRSGLEIDRLLALHRALEELEELDSRQCRVVELRYFLGLTLEETAAALRVSRATVKRDWVATKYWLANRLDPDGKSRKDSTDEKNRSLG